MLITLRENHYLCSQWFEIIFPRSASLWGSLGMQLSPYRVDDCLTNKCSIAACCVFESDGWIHARVHSECTSVPARTWCEGSSDTRWRRHHKSRIQTSRITVSKSSCHRGTMYGVWCVVQSCLSLLLRYVRNATEFTDCFLSDTTGI